MPETTTSRGWFIRVTAPHAEIVAKVSAEGAWDILLPPHTIRVACLHVGKKTHREHAHFLVMLETKIQQQSMKLRWKRIFTEPRCISMKPWDGRLGGESALSYLHHDDQADFFDYVGVTAQQLEEARVVHANVSARVDVVRQRASGHCVERILGVIRQNPTIQYSRQTICLMILNLIRDGFMYEPGDYMIKKYVEEIWAKHMTHTQWELYARARASELTQSPYEYTQRLREENPSNNT